MRVMVLKHGLGVMLVGLGVVLRLHHPTVVHVVVGGSLMAHMLRVGLLVVLRRWLLVLVVRLRCSLAVVPVAAVGCVWGVVLV